MKRSIEKIIKVMFIIIVIMAMAAPQAVLAQDLVPTDAPAASSEVVTTDVPADAPVVEETAVPTEVATEAVVEEATEAAVETAVPTEAPVVEETVAEVVDVMSIEELILYDENGNPLPMGSAAAEEAISDADPWFINSSDSKHIIAYFTSQSACNSWLANPPVGAGDPTYSYNCFVNSTPIQAAINDNRSTGSTIHLTGTFTNETLTISKNITIDGGGTTTIKAPSNIINGSVDINSGGENYYGLIYINKSSGSNITVNIQNLTLDGSTINNSTYSNSNNAVGVLIGNNAIVNIINAIITGFARTGGSNPDSGIGVAQFSNNSQLLTLDHVTISNNNIGYIGSSSSKVVGEYNNFLGNTRWSLDFYHGRLLNSYWGIDPFSANYFGTPRAETSAQYYFYYDFNSNGINEPGEEVYYLFLNCPDNQYTTLGGSPCTFNGTVINRNAPGFLKYGTYTSVYSKTNFDRFASGAKLGDIEPYEVWPILSERDCPDGMEAEGNTCVPEKKMDICHADNGAPTYTLNNVSVKSILNTSTCTLKSSGHGGHPNDIIPPYTCASGVTFAGQGDQTIIANGCVVPEPKITVVKSITSSGPYVLDYVIEYQIEVTNIGNIPLTNVTIADPAAPFAAGTCDASATLDVGATKTCTTSHTVTQADVDNGYFDNTATGDSAETDPKDSTVRTEFARTGDLSIEKTVTSVEPYYVVGSTITYNIEVTNTGNITLDDVVITDDNADIGTCVPANPVASLAPNSTITCSASHIVSDLDISAGLIYINTATVEGFFGGKSYTDESSVETPLHIPGCMDETAINYDPTATIDDESCIAPAPAILLEKVVNPGSYGVVGAVLGYTYTVTNEGNVPVTGLTVEDDKTSVTCSTTTIAVGASTTCTASYTIKQTDLDAGSVINLAEAKAYYGEYEVSSNASATATANAGPALFVAKTVTSAGPYVTGSTIAYNLVITNTGNLTLANVTVADPKAAIIGTCSAASLAPAASFTCSASHVVSALDIASGLSYLNTATATSGTITASGSVTSTLDILGCMDPAATNFNTSATIADGSCTYPVVPVTGATPALAIPVTGGALIPVTGGTLIVSGLGHSCMTYNNGQVVCWGLNASGQLGDGSQVDKKEAVYVKDLMGVMNLTAGSKHTCALTASGDIWCWGENSSGQLGNGSTANSNVPVQVSGLPAKVLSITAGEEFTCVQLMNQEVWCWGKNNLGQLNDGTTKNQPSPVKSKLSSMMAQISGGQGLLLGSDVLGSVNEWVKAQAAAVKELENTLSISANRWGETGCAVSADGSVKCWGSDLLSIPVTGAASAMEVGTGLDHNCTINNDQSVSCWGSNGSGQLGDGTNKDSDSAKLVKNMSLAKVLAVGAHHTCVLSGTGNTAMCWGENTYGQLGNGSTSNSNVPVLVVLP